MAGDEQRNAEMQSDREERRPVRQVRQPEMVSADYILIALAAARHYDVIGISPSLGTVPPSCS